MALPERADPYVEPKRPDAADRGGVNFAPGKWLGAGKGIFSGLRDLLDSDDLETGQGFLDRISAEGKRRTEMVDDPDTTFAGRTAKGAEDIVLGAASLAGALLPFTERRPGETEEESEARAERDALETTRAAAKGAIVAPLTTGAALLPGTDVPLRSLSADPVGTALDLFPAAKVAKVGAAKVGAKAADIIGDTKLGKAVGKAAADVATKVAESKVGKWAQEAADTGQAQFLDNLAGTEVKDLPAFIRGIDRMGDVLADEAAALRERVKASPNPAADDLVEYVPAKTARVETGAGRRPKLRLTDDQPRRGADPSKMEPDVSFFVDAIDDPEFRPLPEYMGDDPAATPSRVMASAVSEDLAEPSPGSLVAPLDRERLQGLAGRAATDVPALRVLDDAVARDIERRTMPYATAGERGDFREALLRTAMSPNVEDISVQSRPTGVRTARGDVRPLPPRKVDVDYDGTPGLPDAEPPTAQQYRDAVLLDQLHRESGVPWGTDEVQGRRDLRGFQDLLSPAPAARGAGAFDEGRPVRMLLREHMAPYRSKLLAVAEENGPRAAAARAELERLKNFEETTYRGHRLYVPPRVKVALEIEESVRRPQDGLGEALIQSLKSGNTSRSLRSGINNLMGNAILQAIRRAGHRGYRVPPRPTAVPTRAIRKGAMGILGTAGGPVGSELTQWAATALEREWVKRRGKELPDDYTVRKWRALDKEKIADTTQQQVELQGGLTEYADQKQPGLGAIGAANKPLEWFYRNGDVWAKSAEASRTFDDVVRLLDRQPEGKSTRFRGRDGAVVEVLRSGPEQYSVKVGPRRTVVEADSPQFDRLVGSIAAEQADRIFFDYNRTSRWAKRLRTSKAGMFSPFYSWMSLAMDLPGRKGLLSHAITGPDFVLDRNWYGLADAGWDAHRLAQRSAVHGLLVHQLQNSKDSELLAMLEKFPRQYKMMLVGEMANPAYTEVEDLGNWNSFSPASLWLSAADAAQSLGVTTKEQAELSKATDSRSRQLAKLLMRQQTGRGFTPEDAAELAGMAGGFAHDALSLIDRGSKPGADDSFKDRLMETFARGLVGGTAVDLAQIAGSGAQEWRGHPDRWGSMRPPPTPGQERIEKGFLQWVIRKFTGVGWQAIASDPKTFDKNLNMVKRAWKTGLRIKEQETAALTAARAPGASEELKDQMRERIRSLRSMDKIIDAEIKEMRDDLIEALMKVRAASEKQRARNR